MKRLIETKGTTALQYGSGQGTPELREQILEICALEGITDAHPDDVVVTTGSQQALDIVTRIFIDPGDVILAEAPSYVGALGVFRSYEAEVRHVPMDADGLIPTALEQAIIEERAAGRRVKFLYTIPNFHNPAGVTLSLERRHEVLAICKRHGILIVEDNPYGLLGFDREPSPAMRAFDDEGVVYLGSFSKTFAPGLRLGYLAASEDLFPRLVMLKQASDLHASRLSQYIVHEAITGTDWAGRLESLAAFYRARRDMFAEALTRHFTGLAQWSVPPGGVFFWVRLKESLDTRELLPDAIARCVAFMPGEDFYPGAATLGTMRLNYSHADAKDADQGLRTLAELVSKRR
jgi:DNA-binding transcriptional MocR family regulator